MSLRKILWSPARALDTVLPFKRCRFERDVTGELEERAADYKLDQLDVFLDATELHHGYILLVIPFPTICQHVTDVSENSTLREASRINREMATHAPPYR